MVKKKLGALEIVIEAINALTDDQLAKADAVLSTKIANARASLSNNERADYDFFQELTSHTALAPSKKATQITAYIKKWSITSFDQDELEDFLGDSREPLAYAKMAILRKWPQVIVNQIWDFAKRSYLEEWEEIDTAHVLENKSDTIYPVCVKDWVLAPSYIRLEVRDAIKKMRETVKRDYEKDWLRIDKNYFTAISVLD